MRQVREASLSKKPETTQHADYTEVSVTDDMTDLLLDDIFNEVVEELESVLGNIRSFISNG